MKFPAALLLLFAAGCSATRAGTPDLGEEEVVHLRMLEAVAGEEDAVEISDAVLSLRLTHMPRLKCAGLLVQDVETLDVPPLIKPGNVLRRRLSPPEPEVPQLSVRELWFAVEEPRVADYGLYADPIR